MVKKGIMEIKVWFNLGLCEKCARSVYLKLLPITNLATFTYLYKLALFTEKPLNNARNTPMSAGGQAQPSTVED